MEGHGKEALTDLSQTLRSIAGNAHALTLKLAQQIPVCTENSNTGVVVMKSAQDGA
jgi:hypothetical protein